MHMECYLATNDTELTRMAATIRIGRYKRAEQLQHLEVIHYGRHA